MERLTQTSDKGGVAFTFDLTIFCEPNEAKKILRLAEKLKKYEDAEEQGRLLQLPVKKGDIVWELCECDDGVFRIFPMEVKDVVPYGAPRYTSRSSVWNIYAESDYTKMYKSFYDIGTSVFLTEEAAKDKLKEMEESHDRK